MPVCWQQFASAAAGTAKDVAKKIKYVASMGIFENDLLQTSFQ